jgi:hypothetical protein
MMGVAAPVDVAIKFVEAAAASLVVCHAQIFIFLKGSSTEKTERMQRSTPAATAESEGEAKKRQIALGVGLLFMFLALGAAGFLIYYYLFGEGKKQIQKSQATANPGANAVATRANQRTLYKCVLGKCIALEVDNDNADIEHNIANNIWFENQQCQGPGWKPGDVPPCQGKFKCAPPPPSLSKTGASAKGSSLQGNLCQHVPDSEVATQCGANGEQCSNSDICQEQCVAQYFTCPDAAVLSQTQCVRASAKALNSATTDVMIHENCPLLCTACFKKSDASGCEHGGRCNPFTGDCECSAMWAGPSCAEPRYGTCYAGDFACGGNSGSIVNNCGPNSFPAFSCASGGFFGHRVTNSCTCVSVENVQPGAPQGSNNLATSDFSGGTSFVTPNPGANWGCNTVPNAVCRLDVEDDNSCIRDFNTNVPGGATVQCSNQQCSTDDDCKKLCGDHAQDDGTCTATSDGKRMCTCANNGDTKWIIVGDTPTPGTGLPIFQQ